MANECSESMKVRFLINTRTQRIVYAEAGKEFVDFLLSFLSMPMGSVLNLLQTLTSSPKNIGSVSNLYDSILNLPSEFMNTDKSHLLKPDYIAPYCNNTLGIENGNYYVCRNTHSQQRTHNISTNSADICVCGHAINCRVQMRKNNNVKQSRGSSGQAVEPAQENSGYVKEMLTFIITDDLEITGSSTITSIMLLNKLNVKDLGDLQERNAIVDQNKALEILAASLVSTTVLNDVFGDQFCVTNKVSNDFID